MRPILRVTVPIVILSSAYFLVLRPAQRDAARMRTQGRLSQLRVALYNYQTVNGSIPPREVSANTGEALHSWLAPLLPFIEEHQLYELLDTTQPWNSERNEPAIRFGEPVWNWMSDDNCSTFAFAGTESIWNEDGTARGSLDKFPGSILLIAAPVDGIHPLKPFSLTSDNIRKIVDSGQMVLCITSDGQLGTAEVEDGALRFRYD